MNLDLTNVPAILDVKGVNRHLVAVHQERKMTIYVTISQIAERADKHPNSVLRALDAAGKKPEREKGIHGLRMELKEANDFMLRQWPGTRPLTRADLLNDTTPIE